MQGSLDTLTPDLQEYAEALIAAGFVVYAAREIDGLPLGFFHYSRVVDGQTVYGTVSAEYFGGHSHSMPIKPSRQHGNALAMGGDRLEALTVAEAERTARLSNSNQAIGRHKNAVPWGVSSGVYLPVV